jgi:hypothetical protein
MFIELWLYPSLVLITHQDYSHMGLAVVLSGRLPTFLKDTDDSFEILIPTALLY